MLSYDSPVPELIPSPSNLLTVWAGGHTGGCQSSSQLQTPIYRGTDISAQPEYISERATRKSNSAVLRHAGKGDLLATTYRLGFSEPHIGRLDPSTHHNELQYGEGEQVVQVKTKWWSTYASLLDPASGQEFQWKYEKSEVESKKKRLMTLTTKGKDEKVIAVLLRTGETRTPGTSKWDMGNGGQLIFAPEAVEYLEESVIVATCLMMLKREVDRNRNSNVVVV